MLIENICTKTEYTNNQGETKTYWNKVGTLKTTDDGKKFISLGMFPITDFYVFPPKEDNQGGF